MFQALTETDASNRRIRRPAKIGELVAICEAIMDDLLDVIGKFQADGRAFLSLSGAAETTRLG